MKETHNRIKLRMSSTVNTSPPAVSRFSTKCGSLDVSQPYELSGPVTGIAFIP
jgi:hypothetical protein